MLNSYYTEKLLGLQEAEVKNILEKEESYEISIEQPRKTCTCPRCGEPTNRIEEALESDIPSFVKCAKTYYNWFTPITNSFFCPYTNGFTEGCNNKIKVLKRNAYGLQDFKRFRNRILFMFSHQGRADA